MLRSSVAHDDEGRCVPLGHGASVFTSQSLFRPADVWPLVGNTTAQCSIIQQKNNYIYSHGIAQAVYPQASQSIFSFIRSLLSLLYAQQGV